MATVTGMPRWRWHGAMEEQRRGLVERGYVCPRCKLPLKTIGEVLPSDDRGGFIGVVREDESGVVGIATDLEASSAERTGTTAGKG